MAVELIARNEDLQKESARIAVIVGDEDSSTIAAVRRESTKEVLKWSDTNHVTKAVSNALWKLKVPPAVIDYLKYCFSCALKKNKGDVEATKAAIDNIVNHAFDDHATCGDWCRYRDDPVNYVHRGLPGGKGLSGEALRTSLTSVFAKFSKNAERLAPCASSQSNESFNNMVASKNPKARHYGASESNDYRVAAAVCQKNMGTKYVLAVNEKMGLSSGLYTEKFRSLKDRKRKMRAEREKTVEHKRRRRFLKKQRCIKKVAAEKREGITYLSDCGLNTIASDFVDHSTSADIAEEAAGASIVVFDLETSGLGSTAEICQIAAKHKEKEFNAYIVPSRGITPSASAITGLQVHGGQMFLNNVQVNTMPPRLVMVKFVEFLRSFNDGVILVAHNGFRLDAPFIVRTMLHMGLLDDFSAAMKGFADTLPIFRRKLEQRKKEKKSFSQSALANDLLEAGDCVGAHNAIFDVQLLDKLIKKVCVTREEFLCHAKSVAEVVREMEQSSLKTIHKRTMERLKSEPGVSAGMIDKIAAAGIDLSILQQTYSAAGVKGIELLLGQDVRGRPRVTKNKKVIQGILMAVKKSLETISDVAEQVNRLF